MKINFHNPHLVRLRKGAILLFAVVFGMAAIIGALILLAVALDWVWATSVGQWVIVIAGGIAVALLLFYVLGLLIEEEARETARIRARQEKKEKEC